VPTPLAISLREAAETLGVSLDYFDKHVRPDLKVVRRGHRVLVPVREIERWLERHAMTALP
jgi:excisionase family DNA binding protein